MQRSTLLVTAGLAVTALLFGSSGLAMEKTVQPAGWDSYDMIVDLTDLPKRYSCNELWYKFRDVLWNIGARRITEILPYDCEASLGAQARSPRVHLVFSLLSPRHNTPVGTASLRGQTTTIRFRPGFPRTLDHSDCALLQQMNDTLFAALPVKVESAGFECTLHPRAHAGFGLTVQAFTPIHG